MALNETRPELNEKDDAIESLSFFKKVSKTIDPKKNVGIKNNRKLITNFKHPRFQSKRKCPNEILSKSLSMTKEALREDEHLEWKHPTFQKDGTLDIEQVQSFFTRPLKSAYSTYCYSKKKLFIKNDEKLKQHILDCKEALDHVRKRKLKMPNSWMQAPSVRNTPETFTDPKLCLEPFNFDKELVRNIQKKPSVSSSNSIRTPTSKKTPSVQRKVDEGEDKTHVISKVEKQKRPWGFLDLESMTDALKVVYPKKKQQGDLSLTLPHGPCQEFWDPKFIFLTNIDNNIEK